MALLHGPLLRESRSRIAAFSLTQAETDALRALDEIVLEEIAYCENLQPYLLEDDPQIPLAQWWWHLGKIRLRTYPASLLPPELRSVYLAASHQNAAA
ncbi:MAG: hypothetical protein IPP10_00955 [Candidatus Competibacteraceae bacterium]|nr:hypothetical protein [Candidatus Competibacteraceae bacterium]MBK9950122.1 hypothetical protein [Candidatus Competibacteraceae bacterium]